MAKALSVFMLLMILAVPGYSQDSSDIHAVNTLDGTISSIDWVGGVITVNDSMLISVPSGIVVHKGDDQIALSDLNLGDPVTITYYDDPPGTHKATSIIVQYNGDFAV